MNIVGKGFTIPQFRHYVEGLQFTGWTPNFVVVHNTSAPDLKLYSQWQQRKDWTGEQWMRNLAAYYSGMGWKAGPHLFVAPDFIWVLTPLTQRGTHSPTWNSFTWGVETVGEFEREKFEGSPTQANLVGALAILHERVGLNPADYKRGVRGLHFHKEDPKTTHKTCPGKNIVKAKLVLDVVVAMAASDPGAHVHVPESAATNAANFDIRTPARIQECLNDWFSETKSDWRTAKIDVKKLNTAVRKIVAQHQKQGFTPLRVDGVIGNLTKAAVALYQSEHPPLVVDGIAGPLTRLRLAQKD